MWILVRNLRSFLDFAAASGIAVRVTKLAGETQGLSAGGAIALDPEAGTKTLIHELAHELAHQEGIQLISRETQETEAEAVAYVVAAHFGVEGSRWFGFFDTFRNRPLWRNLSKPFVRV